MGFQSVIIDGLFYEKDGQILVKKDGDIDPVVVEEVLKPLIDRRIQITIHHWPPEPINEKHWGGGCCMWEPTGKCPAGHHENPEYLLHMVGKGMLRTSDNGWLLEFDDHTFESLPFDKMVGHLGRLVAITLMDESTFADDFNLDIFDNIDISKPVDPEVRAAQMERLEHQTKQLRETVGDFVNLLKDLNKKGD